MYGIKEEIKAIKRIEEVYCLQGTDVYTSDAWNDIITICRETIGTETEFCFERSDKAEFDWVPVFYCTPIFDANGLIGIQPNLCQYDTDGVLCDYQLETIMLKKIYLRKGR